MAMTFASLIPARSGSKGVPEKNIREICGKSLVEHAVDQALNSGIDDIYISTDSSKIADLAKSRGALVPFIRPPEISRDDSSDHAVVSHFISWMITNNKWYDSIVYLRPTAPLREATTIKNAMNLASSENSWSCIRSVSKVEGSNHPYWCYKENGKYLESFVDGIKLSDYYRRQLLPSCFRLNGVIDIFSVSYINQNDDLYGRKILKFLISDLESFDIDSELDLEICRFLFEERNAKSFNKNR